MYLRKKKTDNLLFMFWGSFQEQAKTKKTELNILHIDKEGCWKIKEVNKKKKERNFLAVDLIFFGH